MITLVFAGSYRSCRDVCESRERTWPNNMGATLVWPIDVSRDVVGRPKIQPGRFDACPLKQIGLCLMLDNQ